MARSEATKLASSMRTGIIYCVGPRRPIPHVAYSTAIPKYLIGQAREDQHAKYPAMLENSSKALSWLCDVNSVKGIVDWLE